MMARRDSTLPVIAWALPLAVLSGVLIVALPPTLALIALGAGVLALGIVSGLVPALVWALVIAPLRALLDIRAPSVLPSDLLLMAVGLALAGWGIERLARRAPLLPLQASPAVIAVGLFVVGGGLSFVTALSPTAWLSEWLKWLFALLFVWFVLHVRRWEWVAYGLAVAGAANAILGVYVFFGGSGVDHFAINTANFRAFGTFEQPNPFGGFMGILTPFLGAIAVGALVRAYRAWRVTRQLPTLALVQATFFGLCAIVTASALVFSWSRGAWLGLGVSAVVTVVALPRKLRYGLMLLAVAVIGVGGLWASGRLPASITDRVVSSFSDLISANDVRGVDVTPENYAAIERFAHWQAAVEMLRLSPWTGVGLGNYEAAYTQTRLLGWDFALGHAHNYYLNVLAETGIIGFSSYLGMWGIIFLITWRARRHPDPIASAAAAGLLGTWSYIAVHSLTDHLYVNTVFLHVGALIGLAALLYQHTWKPQRLSP
ncbi:MAG: O-antigen ligase family protein [Anaerolineae bacterium]|nr:O-antigen ligase family protein [Anaerolineae bacterium]